MRHVSWMTMLYARLLRCHSAVNRPATVSIMYVLTAAYAVVCQLSGVQEIRLASSYERSSGHRTDERKPRSK